MKSDPRPLLAFIVCAAIWGSTFLVIRYSNDAVPPLWGCCLRFVLAFVLLSGLALAMKHPFPKGDALKASLLYGFMEFGVSFPLLYYGEATLGSGLAAVQYAVCPVTALFAARELGMEKLSRTKLIAGLTAFLGVGVVHWNEVVAGGAPKGMLIVFLAAVAAPLAGLALQRGPQQSAFWANAVGVLVGLPIVLICSFALGEQHVMPSTWTAIWPIAYLAAFGSVGAFAMFAWLVQRWSTTTTSFLGVIVPVIAVILGAFFRAEKIGAAAIFGAGVVLISVVFVLRAEANQRIG